MNIFSLTVFSNNKKWFLLVILSIIWGSSFILIKKGLMGLSPLQLGALRIIISAFFIFIFGFHTLKKIPRGTWKWLVISGFIGTFFPVFLFAFAETEIDSATTSILNSLVPLNTMLLGFAIFKIASTKRQVLGVIIGFSGTALLIISGANLNPEQNYMYASFVLLSGIFYGLNVNIIKRYLQDITSVSIVFGNFTAIIVPACLVLIWTDFFENSIFKNLIIVKSIGYVVVLSLFGTVLAKILFNKLVQMATPVFASSVTYLMPIVAVGWGVLDGELFNAIQGLAAFLILLGVYLSHKGKT